MSQYGSNPQDQYGQQPNSGSSPQPAYGQDYGQSDPSGQNYAQPGAYGSYQPQPGGMQQQYAAYGQYGPNGGEHPQAQTVLILGILGFFTTITAYIGWYMGGKAKKEIEAGAPYRWDGNLKIGYIISKVLSIISFVALGLVILFAILGIAGIVAMGDA